MKLKNYRWIEIKQGDCTKCGKPARMELKHGTKGNWQSEDPPVRICGYCILSRLNTLPTLKELGKES